jgi:hypothetical protein
MPGILVAADEDAEGGIGFPGVTKQQGEFIVADAESWRGRDRLSWD